MAAQKPVCVDICRWMQAKHGKRCFAPFTGQDWRVFTAYCHLLNAWFSADDLGRPILVRAMQETLKACQPCVLPFAKDAIIAIGDYGFVNQIWPRIVPVSVEKML